MLYYYCIFYAIIYITIFQAAMFNGIFGDIKGQVCNIYWDLLEYSIVEKPTILLRQSLIINNFCVLSCE